MPHVYCKNASDTPIVKFDDILIDQGTDDEFLYTQLKPEALEAAAGKCGQTVTINMRDRYDHSYHFISSFIKNHINFHASSTGIKHRE